jgi:hypothetical protein
VSRQSAARDGAILLQLHHGFEHQERGRRETGRRSRGHDRRIEDGGHPAALLERRDRLRYRVTSANRAERIQTFLEREVWPRVPTSTVDQVEPVDLSGGQLRHCCRFSSPVPRAWQFAAPSQHDHAAEREDHAYTDNIRYQIIRVSADIVQRARRR